MNELSILGVANDAPDAVKLDSSALGRLLMGIQLVIGKNLKGEAGTEDEDGEVVGPFNRSRQGGSSAVLGF